VYGAFYMPQPQLNLHMAMAITMHMHVVARFFFASEVTTGPLSSAHVHCKQIKRTPESRFNICGGFEDTDTNTTKMPPLGKCIWHLPG
jgi:hypothetical protein